MKSDAEVFNHNDFTGGYFTNVPSERMKDNELLQADNCYWRNGLEKRQGKASFVSFVAAAIRGGIRTRIASVWYTILGVETTGSAVDAVEFRYGTAGTFTTLNMPSSTSKTFQAGYDVQFAVLDERVCAVNGYDKPAVIWASASTFQTDTIEEYDKRTNADDDWQAGQYYPSLTTTSYLTDTSDAQSSASADFLLATYTVSSGFWVACAHTFNKVTLYDCKANATGSFTFEYYGRASSGVDPTWVAFTPVNTPTWSAVGNKVIEMNFPIDAADNAILMEVTPSLNATVGGWYAMRFRNGNTIDSTTAWACQGMKVEHSQYLTQLLLNDKPDTVQTHKSHLFLGCGNWIRRSPMNQITGWREQDRHYFSEGGSIQSMVPHLDYLSVNLDNALYGIFGNSWESFAERLLVNGKGPINKRSAVIVNEELYFVARDGIYGWNGSRLLKVAKHIQSDLDSWTLTNACAVNYKGEYWVAFPTNGYLLLFDPDTLRIDEAGDGRMSFFRFPSYQVDQFLNFSGEGDTGSFYAIVNAASQVRLDQLETSYFDKISASSTITMIVQTRYLDFENPQENKTFRRLKPTVADVSATGGIDHTIKMYRLDRYGTASTSTVIQASAATGIHTEDIGVPPNMDGKVIGIGFTHDTQYKAKFLGFSIEVERREY